MQLSYFKGGSYPFESASGIVSSLAIFNLVSEVDIFSTVGLRAPKLDSCFYDAGPTRTLLSKFVQDDVEDHVPANYFTSNVHHRYCDKCAVMGYHSIFSFVAQADRCLLHGTKFIQMCMRCSRLHLSAEPHSSGVYCCSVCGYFIPTALDQLTFRGDEKVRQQMNEIGESQKKWFSAIMARQSEGYPYSDIAKLERYADNENMTQAVMLLLGVDNPFFTDVGGVQPQVELHHWKAEACSPLKVGGSVLDDLEAKIIVACHEIENSFLGSHKACLKRVEKTLGYLAKDAYVCPICPQALAYVYFRIRLALRHGDDIAVASVGELGFSHIRRQAEVNTWLVNVDDRFFKIFFLKILDAINIALQCDNSVDIRISAGDGILYKMIEGFSTSKGAGIEFTRPLNLCAQECGEQEIYQYAMEAEHFLVKKTNDRYHLILCKNKQSFQHPPIRV